jgi:glycosyltransferase involved in cell wall biosynthesis
MFAGNIGEAQDFESTLNAMKILQERGVSNVHLILVGDGRKRQWVDKFIQQNSLGNTVHCVGQHPLESMGKFFAQSDVLYISLKDSLIFNLTCPTKLQAYMSAGKPVLAMINGDGAAILKDAGCGLSVPSGASSELADKMLEMSQMSSVNLHEMGSKGKAYCKEHFSFIRNMSLLNRMIDNVGV